MKTILRLIAKEYRLFWSDPVAVSLTFIVPMLLIMLWGSIFGNADSGPDHLRLVFLSQSDSPVAQRIERVLDTSQTFELIRTYKDDQGQDVPFDTTSVKDFIGRGKRRRDW